MIRCDSQAVKTFKSKHCLTISLFFFLVQMSWTETTSQMIQDDSQANVCETQPEKMQKLNKLFLETENKVYIFTFVN